ncbi:uncharacterized protein LOC123708238 [Pieris brassicae]|nr:uncharacterized protein LOC123708238 [Pieris brassicae]
MVKSRNGKNLLMFKGYTYYSHKHLRNGIRWSCTQMGSRSCRAFMHVTKEMIVVRAYVEHTHQPSKYLLGNVKKGSTLEFYLRPNGRINLRLNNFTFYKHLKARTNAHRWSCTAYGSKWKCKAHLIITDKLEVLKASINHSHPPSLKKDPRLPLLHPIQNGGNKNKENGLPAPVNPMSLTPLHDYLVAHSVYNNY